MGSPRTRRWNGPRAVAPSRIDPSSPREGAVDGDKHPYRLGREYEQAVRGILERRGWYVERRYASKGIHDLLAVRCPHAMFVQCKLTGDIGSAAWNALIGLAVPFGAVPVVAFRVGTREHAFMRLDDCREFRGRGRPWTRIDPGTLREVELQLDLAA